jgi:transcriptional regulator with XRE-family HTH domain/anti-sigma regulatory factor (Ser/Thr protein kinase)
MRPVAEVVSLGDRLRLRREELGLSQAQAARELDVARTAYRLWEMEAAKPSPDRWRLISRWLGVSVTTMLLADELISAEEAKVSTVAEARFDGLGQEREVASTARQGGFFRQSRALLLEGLATGSITEEQAEELGAMLDRLEAERRAAPTAQWAPGELRKAFPSSPQIPRAAREAVALVAGDIPTEALETARLLTSELVTNSVKFGPPAPAIVGVFVEVARERIRIEISDEAEGRPRLRAPSDEGGYGLTLVDTLASEWGTDLQDGHNVTWFELRLPAPGA